MTLGLWKGKRVGVLMGGVTKEREISLKTGKAVAEALVRRGHHVIEIDAREDLPERLQREKVDVVFVALHGKYGEDGCVQGLLEWMHIPYTGGGVMASAIGMDKVVSKRVARSLGMTVPDDVVFVGGVDDPTTFVKKFPLTFPVIVKPSREGSTINATVVTTAAELPAALMKALTSDSVVLVERYIGGREVTIALLDGKALPSLEIVPKSGFYDFASKYTKGMTEYIVPARIDETVAEKLSRESEMIFHAIDCAGWARVDFIVETKGQGYFLEINTVPGMTETSLVPKAAAHRGISYEELCERILDSAALKVKI